MNIHEYQARQLLAQYGVALPPAEVFTEAAPARDYAAQLFAKGETLAAIARNAKISLSALQAANPGVNPKHLRTGQTVNLPPP